MYKTANNPFEENIFSESTVSTSRGALLAVMNVEIRPGQKDKIFIHEFDNEYELAQGFVHKHGLPAKALAILQKQIQGNKAVVKQSTTARPEDSNPASSRKEDRSGAASNRLKDIEDERIVKKSEDEEEHNNTDKMSHDMSEGMSRSKSTTDITNRLYNENLMKSKYLFELEQRALEKLQKIQAEATSHTPEINRISNILASQRRKNTNIQDHLVELGNQRTHRKERAASLKVKKELEQCPFKPQLNRMSNRLMTSRPESTFSKGLIRNTEHAYDNLFKPALNKISKEIMQKKAPFMTRQKEYEEMRQAKINKMYREKKANETIDPRTGKQFFKPESSKHKPRFWNENQLDIGEYLYEKGRTKEHLPLKEKKVVLNRHSEELVRNMHTKRVVWLFGELDSDQDGLISSERINIQSISDAMLEIIMPILFEMEEFGFQLNLDEFRIALEQLHKSLTTVQKSILYDYKKKRVES